MTDTLIRKHSDRQPLTRTVSTRSCERDDRCYSQKRMGMDAVEIVMLAEERFGLEIKNDEAEKIRTPGMLIDLIFGKLKRAKLLFSSAGAGLRLRSESEFDCARNCDQELRREK